MSHMGLYALNPTPKQRYNSYKGEMNGTCKNLLLDKRENKYIRKTYFNRNLKTTSVNQKWTTDVSDFKTAMSKFKSLEELKQAMIDYIEYHNNSIITVKRKGLTPIQIRNQALQLI